MWFKNKNRIMISKVLVSSDVNNSIKHTFTLNLDTTFRNVTRVSLMNIALPISDMNIRTGVNDKMYILVGATPYTITLTQGSFNATELATEIETKLNATGSGTYTVVYTTTTFKFIITNASNNFAFTDGANNAYKQTGIVPSLQVQAPSQVSSNAIQLNTSHSILLNLNNLSKPVYVPRLHIVGTFLVNVDENYGYIYFGNRATLKGQDLYYTNNVDIAFLDVSLVNAETGNAYEVISDFSFLLEIEHES